MLAESQGMYIMLLAAASGDLQLLRNWQHVAWSKCWETLTTSRKQFDMMASMQDSSQVWVVLLLGYIARSQGRIRKRYRTPYLMRQLLLTGTVAVEGGMCTGSHLPLSGVPSARLGWHSLSR